MVGVRFPWAGSGIAPTLKRAWDINNMTHHQKMWLARNRIWGNMIGGNARSGYKEMKKAISGPSRAAVGEHFDLKSINPFF